MPRLNNGPRHGPLQYRRVRGAEPAYCRCPGGRHRTPGRTCRTRLQRGLRVGGQRLSGVPADRWWGQAHRHPDHDAEADACLLAHSPGAEAGGQGQAPPPPAGTELRTVETPNGILGLDSHVRYVAKRPRLRLRPRLGADRTASHPRRNGCAAPGDERPPWLSPPAAPVELERSFDHRVPAESLARALACRAAEPLPQRRIAE